MQPLILHAHGTGPNPYKVAIALEMLGLPYDVYLWQFGDAKNGVKGAEFTKINPNGRVSRSRHCPRMHAESLVGLKLIDRIRCIVPSLEDKDNNVTSWESGAIINYLLRVYDKENKLGPRSDKEQDRVDFDKWIFFLVSTLGPMMGQVNWFRHYHPERNDDALKRYEEQAYRCFEVLEGQLKSHGGSFILPGSTPSAVDLHFYPWVYQYSFASLSLDSYPTVAKWLSNFGELKEVKSAYEKIPKGKEM